MYDWPLCWACSVAAGSSRRAGRSPSSPRWTSPWAGRSGSAAASTRRRPAHSCNHVNFLKKSVRFKYIIDQLKCFTVAWNVFSLKIIKYLKENALPMLYLVVKFTEHRLQFGLIHIRNIYVRHTVYIRNRIEIYINKFTASMKSECFNSAFFVICDLKFSRILPILYVLSMYTLYSVQRYISTRSLFLWHSKQTETYVHFVQ